MKCMMLGRCCGIIIFSEIGCASPRTRPSFTSETARRTSSVATRLSAPRSSSLPHRPHASFAIGGSLPCTRHEICGRLLEFPALELASAGQRQRTAQLDAIGNLVSRCQRPAVLDEVLTCNLCATG